MHHVTFFGDGEKTFALTTEMILELERKTGVGIAALYARFMRQDFHFLDMVEIIRTGLIGGGTSPEAAQVLVDTYAKPRPVIEVFTLAFDILDARWNGTPEVPAKPLDEIEHSVRMDQLWQSAASTGDIAAAINETLKDAGI